MKEDKIESDIKFMNITPQMVFELEEILNYLVQNNTYNAQIGDTTIFYKGVKENTSKGKRQIFEIQRKVKKL